MRLVVFSLLTASLPAQILPVPFPRPFREIEQFLQLTREQMDRINRNSAEFDRWNREKQLRSFTVSREIAEETAAEPLNPSALGLRYAELEAIRREVTDREKKLIADNFAVLTEAQKVRFKALEEAIKLQPVIDEARAIRLLANDCAVPAGFGGVIRGGLGFSFPCGGIGTPFPLPLPNFLSQPATR
ncbi:MAG: hypothetical protein FJW30_23650 [Acidobacteria bacterium]|nr:hypothetical protein [Acidobacteriota bacterium]